MKTIINWPSRKAKELLTSCDIGVYLDRVLYSNYLNSMKHQI